MAITLSEDPVVQTMTLVMEDWRGQRRTYKIPLKGSVLEADVIAALTALDGLTNARVVSAELLAETRASGFKANAIQAANRDIQNFMALNFAGSNPINPLKTVFKTVSIPAFIAAIEHSSGSGVAVTDNPTLNAFTDFLEDNLAYTAANGTVYTGFLTYRGGQHLTGAEIVDNR